MYENHGHVAIPCQQSSSRGEADHLLATLPGVDKIREFFDGLALPIILPLVVGQDDIVETETILMHVHEPHGHAAGPSHKSEELIDSESMRL